MIPGVHLYFDAMFALYFENDSMAPVSVKACTFQASDTGLTLSFMVDET